MELLRDCVGDNGSYLTQHRADVVPATSWAIFLFIYFLMDLHSKQERLPAIISHTYLDRNQSPTSQTWMVGYKRSKMKFAFFSIHESVSCSELLVGTNNICCLNQEAPEYYLSFSDVIMSMLNTNCYFYKMQILLKCNRVMVECYSCG